MRKRPERAFPFLRGCAGMSDRRERKATPSGVFDWTQSGQSGAWRNHNKLSQAFREMPGKSLCCIKTARPLPAAGGRRPKERAFACFSWNSLQSTGCILTQPGENNDKTLLKISCRSYEQEKAASGVNTSRLFYSSMKTFP